MVSGGTPSAAPRVGPVLNLTKGKQMMSDTLKLALMLRAALEEAHDAMQAFADPEGNMPENTGEFRDLKLALESAVRALGAGTIEDVDHAESDRQRARDKCIGAHGYDISRLGA